MTMRLRGVALLTGLWAVLVADIGAATTLVTTCGETVRGHVELAHDLDCTGTTGPALTLELGTLDLAGHTITGGDLGGVNCLRSCKVIGPGTITASGFAGLNSFRHAKVLGVNLTDHAYAGAQCFQKCDIQGPADITGNGTGARTGLMAKLRDVNVSDNAGNGVRSANNRGNARAIVRGSTVSGNGAHGLVVDKRVKLIDTAVSGNALHGVVAGDIGSHACPHKTRVALKSSSATGNGTDPGCWVDFPCADLASCLVAPRLDATSTCERSYAVDTFIPNTGEYVDFDVCTGD